MTTLPYGSDNTFNGWDVRAAEEGTTFVSNASGRGMFVSISPLTQCDNHVHSERPVPRPRGVRGRASRRDRPPLVADGVHRSRGAGVACARDLVVQV